MNNDKCNECNKCGRKPSVYYQRQGLFGQTVIYIIECFCCGARTACYGLSLDEQIAKWNKANPIIKDGVIKL